MAFTDKVAAALRAYPPGRRYLIGVSGGRDSVALLHGLVAAGYAKLVVCHLDHGLRGAAARADARFVERLANKLGLAAEIGRADVRVRAKAEKQSLETAARDARYQFFAQAASRHRCRRMFLAHQADDQVETFLFNLLRGAGPAGLAAMALEIDRKLGRSSLTIIRPLLSVWRVEIDAYLEKKGLDWREDATNADPAYATRNRLRAEVLPLLESAMGREVKPALWRAADILGAEEAWLSQLVPVAKGASCEHLKVAKLAEEPVAKQRRMIRAWLQASSATGIGYDEVERIRSLLDKIDGPAKINLPGGRHARRRAGNIFLEGAPPKATELS